METSSQCRLLGPFSLIVQVFLGLLSLSSLLFKRYREYPNRRSWKVWSFDVSKQVLGSFGIHILNVVLSILSGNSPPHKRDSYDDDNPCDYYFLNLLLDTTIGVPILWGILYMLDKLVRRLDVRGVDTGEYGDPPSYMNYTKQLAIYFVGLFSMKLVVYLMMEIFPFLVLLASWILNWSDSQPELQVFLVMFLFPVLLNALQYYLIDSIIQSPAYGAKNKYYKGIHETRDNEEGANTSSAAQA